MATTGTTTGTTAGTTALRIAGVVLLLGGLAGCGGSDSDGGGADAGSAPTDASESGFCAKFNGLYDSLLAGDRTNPTRALAGIKKWADGMADYGTPATMSDEARDGFEVVIAKIQDLSSKAGLTDFQNLDDQLSKADKKAADAFATWTADSCPTPDLSLPSSGS
ncbi:hypothetical protein [Nocardioides sp. URHA0020]|uniref:hypothetical protein n=1 Tax=Nocardioides sp. URHA0020 TaxID=1380392 RepID=UPI00048C1CAE|nr:hypothetical protein [Nocardioides sp. URHA0020]